MESKKVVVVGAGAAGLMAASAAAMYGVIDFYRACQKQGIKPVIGCEVYVAPHSRFDKTSAYEKYYHMVLLLSLIHILLERIFCKSLSISVL